MGCCKGNKNDGSNSSNESELTLTGKLLKIPMAILITLILIVTSPFILIYIWVRIIQYTFGYNPTLFGFLNYFKKEEENDEEEIDEEEFNENNYELVGVEKID